MSASYGDPDVFSAIGYWLRGSRYRKAQRAARAVELEFTTRAATILRHVLECEAADIVPDSAPLRPAPIPAPDRTLLIGDLSPSDAVRIRRLRGR